MSVLFDMSSIPLTRTTGVVQYVRNLTQAFDALDSDLDVVFRRYRGKAGLAAKLDRRLDLIVREYEWRRLLRGDDMRAIHIPFTYGPCFELPAPYLLTAMDLRFLYMPETYPASRRLFLRFMAPRSLRHATCVLAISDYTARNLVEGIGVDSRRVVVTHLAAEKRFSEKLSMAEIATCRERLGLCRPYVLYVGYIEPRKNLTRLVRAFSQLVKREGIVHELVIVGYRYWGYDELDLALSDLEYADRVRFLDHVDDAIVPALYQGASAFALPSLFEGFGIPLVEAMASGTPVVTSNVTSLPEVVGDAGVLVNPHSVDSIADGLGVVLLDGQLRHDLIEKGYRRAGRFSWKRTAQQTLSAYQRVLDGAYA